MGMTLTPINFFSDEIKITPHTATHACHIGRPVSLREFAKLVGDNRGIALYRIEENNELLARIQPATNIFIEGPES